MTNGESTYQKASYLQLFSTIDDVEQAVLTWLACPDATPTGRMIYSCSTAPRTLPSVFENQNFGGKAFLRCLLAYPNVYFLDEDTICRYMSGQKTVAADYSVSFDTNVASYVHAYRSGRLDRMLQAPAQQLFVHLLKRKVNFDYMFYFIENWQTKGMASVADRMRENIVSIEALATADLPELELRGRIQSSVSESELMDRADRIMHRCYESAGSIDVLTRATAIHQTITCILLKMYEIEFTRLGRRHAREKLLRLMDFMHERLHCVFLRELMLALHYFLDQNSVALFRKVRPNSANLGDRIRNTAWDLTLLRFLELFGMIYLDGRYFLPCYVTFDAALTQVLDKMPIRAFYADDVGYRCVIPVGDAKEILEQVASHSELECMFGKLSYADRERRREQGPSDLTHLVSDLEMELQHAVCGGL